MTEWKLEDALVVEREETVKNLLAYGMPPEQICRALKLPPDTVEQYLN
jgi:DNA-binding CsgD family transcriptional regulator